MTLNIQCNICLSVFDAIDMLEAIGVNGKTLCCPSCLSEECGSVTRPMLAGIQPPPAEDLEDIIIEIKRVRE